MEFRTMQTEDREDVLDLLEEAFGVRALFARYLDLDPQLTPSDTLLAVDDGRPIACAQVFTRQIRLRRQTVTLAGIGSVATDPAYRGRGLATRLVRTAMQEAQRRERPIGLLFTRRFDFYERLGWRQISQRLFKLRQAGAEVSRSEWCTRDFREQDLPEVQALYDTYTQGLSGCTVRDGEYWSAQLRFSPSPGERFRVAERGGAIAAYLRSGELEGRRVALEYARAPGAALALAAMLVEEARPNRSLHAPIVPDPELGHALKSVGAHPEPSEDPMPMWRVFDRDRLSDIAGLPASASDRAILDSLVGGPAATFWASDRF